MNYRKAKRDDAAGIVAVMQNAERAGTMLWNPGERQIDVDEFAPMIEQLQSERSGFFVAEDDEGIVGYIAVQVERPTRIRHRAYLIMGMHERIRGQGIGTEFLEYVKDWAATTPLHRLELSVLTTNESAIRLYEKCGFEKESTRRHSLHIDGTYYDEYVMTYFL